MQSTQISFEQLLDISDFSDAIDLMTEIGAFRPGEVSPFPLVSALFKETLVGVPFIILEANIKPGVDSSSYVEMQIVTARNEKITLRDSSRGIFEQMRTEIGRRVEGGSKTPLLGFWVRKGLRFEEVPFTDRDTNITTMSKTYFLQF